MSLVYLDHNATSPLHPEVLEAMLPWLYVPANPSSVHQLGQRARMAVLRATEQIASLVGARPEDVVFTSGATEANHLWFHSMRMQERAAAVLTSAAEHPSLIAAVGDAATHCSVASDGGIVWPDLTSFDGISLMYANHETGVLRGPIPPFNGWIHSDATAALGRADVQLKDHTALTISAHKIGGPMGIGALISTERVFPLFCGGSQQRGRRAGTLNTPSIVGFGAAAQLAQAELSERSTRYRTLQELLCGGLLRLGARVVGANQLPSVVMAIFDGVVAETVVQVLDLHNVCVSAGAACASGSLDPSPVLQAMGDPEPSGGVRFSFGWSTTTADVEAALGALAQALPALQSPM